MMRVQVVPPDWANTWPVSLSYSGFGQIHPAFRRILHQLRMVGDRPHQRGARPQIGRDLRFAAVVGGVRRRVVHEHVGQRKHQRAVGMIDHVGDQLAGGCLGLDAGDELAARRAHHLDLDLRKALVERLDDLLFHLGEVRGVVNQLAFGLGRGDQLGRAEFLLRHRGFRRRERKAGDAGYCDDPGNACSLHGRSSLCFLSGTSNTALRRPSR